MAALFMLVLATISTDSNEVHTTIDAELSLVDQNKVSSFEFEVQSS